MTRVADLASFQVDAVWNLGDCLSGPLWPRADVASLAAGYHGTI